jgi:hypothetical protein
MQGGSYGWLTKISGLLKSHIDMDTSNIKKLVNHQNLIWRLHQIIRSAAGKNAAQVDKLYAVMAKHGLMGKHSVSFTNKLLVSESHKLLKKIKKVFKSTSTSVSTKHFHTSSSSTTKSNSYSGYGVYGPQSSTTVSHSKSAKVINPGTVTKSVTGQAKASFAKVKTGKVTRSRFHRRSFAKKRTFGAASMHALNSK